MIQVDATNSFCCLCVPAPVTSPVTSEKCRSAHIFTATPPTSSSPPTSTTPTPKKPLGNIIPPRKAPTLHLRPPSPVYFHHHPYPATLNTWRVRYTLYSRASSIDPFLENSSHYFTIGFLNHQRFNWSAAVQWLYFPGRLFGRVLWLVRLQGLLGA